VRALRASGRSKAKHLRTRRDVVFAPFGLVSSFVAFTPPGEEAEVATTIAAVAGVDVCAHPTADGGWRVVGRDGQATFRRLPSGGWSYDSEVGDPLLLSPLLRERGLVPEEISDSALVAASLEGTFPDPLHRIARSFDLVENPASLVCSTAPDAMFGSRTTSLGSRLSVGRLRWTHGALGRQASLGFLTTEVEPWETPGFVRFDQALTPFVRRSAEPAGSEQGRTAEPES